MKVLDTADKAVYYHMLAGIKFKKLRCWKHKAPEGFDKA